MYVWNNITYYILSIMIALVRVDRFLCSHFQNMNWSDVVKDATTKHRAIKAVSHKFRRQPKVDLHYSFQV